MLILLIQCGICTSCIRWSLLQLIKQFPITIQTHDKHVPVAPMTTICKHDTFELNFSENSKKSTVADPSSGKVSNKIVNDNMMVNKMDMYLATYTKSGERSTNYHIILSPACCALSKSNLSSKLKSDWEIACPLFSWYPPLSNITIGIFFLSTQGSI